MGAGNAVSGTGVSTLEIPTSLPRSTLPIDLLEVPATKSRDNLVIISSGLHGPEAFTGSTMQSIFLQRILPELDRTKTTFLLVHIINPWGALTGRRVTENNVDLNRNFAEAPAVYLGTNPYYGAINGFLNPDSPAQAGFFEQASFMLKVAKLMLRHSTRHIRHATLRGQYQYPRGIYFGGTSPEPVTTSLTKELTAQIKKTSGRVLVIDLHTGYGRKGFMHAMPNPLPAAAPLVVERSRQMLADTMGEYPLEDVEHDADFYPSTGDFSARVTQIAMSTGLPSVPLLLEFGTMDSQTLRGSVTSLRRVIQENRLHWHGAVSAADKAEIERDFHELFLPRDEKWRSSVIAQFEQHTAGFIRRFQAAKD
ncbi:MAG: hypothetical protein RIQ81_1978 [Pseudomonadota bacterium]